MEHQTKLTNQAITVKQQIGNREIFLTTGNLAKQSNGAVVISCGDTILLATAVMSKTPREGADFFPLIVEYSEKMYSAGKIPGGFFKREARPSVNATLTARLIDRPIRPCFPKDFFHDVQVVITVLSYDKSFSPEFMGIIGASAALSVSDIPFSGPIGAVRVGMVDDNYIVNPSYEEMEKSKLEIIVAGNKDAILMVEASGEEVSESDILEAITFAHDYIKESITLQESLVEKAGKEKVVLPLEEKDADLEKAIRDFMGNTIEQDLIGHKSAIEELLKKLEQDVLDKFVDPEKGNEAQVKKIFSELKKDQIRKTVIKKKVRPDGRAFNEIRPIACETGLLPTTHGSALFTRGETQSLATVTLGSADDEQIEDGLMKTFKKRYYFHYNFPPFSVGEVGFFRTGRRELGHGALAERALKPVLPEFERFPYTLRIVSEILESNGSSSMASVCAGSLSLMDCGVPIKASVSGIAMGLLIEGNDYVILSDIQGLEDHYGDMDFKVAGTSKGITALQLDIKVSGLTKDILKQALTQANAGRLFILSKMDQTIAVPREKLSPNAPQIEYISIDPEKVGMVIGPGGKMIRSIEEATNANIVITDGTSGSVCIFAENFDSLEKAKNMIIMLVKEVEAGEVYEGRVTKIMNFGAFVELVPGKEGLMHISTLSKRRVNHVEDVLEVGQIVTVKVKEIDSQNRINLVPLNPFD
ncbi:polyribonucleotide nucleotidyltransferase [Thermoproteota archaeon]